MTFKIRADELEQNFFSNIKPSFGLLRKNNFQIPPLSEICFWDNIKNSDYAKKYIEECFDFLLLNCSIIKAANPPSASQDSSIVHDTASAMKSVLLSLIHITTFYKKKRSNIQQKDSSEENKQDNNLLQRINPLENKASIIIKNSSLPQVRKVIEFTINQLFNDPAYTIKDIHSMTKYLKSLHHYPCKELKAIRFYNTYLLFHRLKFDKLTKKLFYPGLLEIMKSKLKTSSNSTKLSESIRDISYFLYLYSLVMTIHPELAGELHSLLPFLNSRITNSNPFSSLCYQLHSITKKEIEYPGYSFYKMLEYALNLSPLTNNAITIFFDFQNKLFPSMLYGRENDKMSFKMSYINFVKYYLTNNLGVDSDQVQKLSISDLLKILGMIKFTKKADSKILGTFKLKSSHPETYNIKNKNAEKEEDSDNDEENDDEKNDCNKNDDNTINDNFEKDIDIPLPPYIPFSLVRIQPSLYLNPDNLIMMQTNKAGNLISSKSSFYEDELEREKMKEKRKRKETKRKGKNENFEESYNDKNLEDDTEYYMYNCVLHKVYIENVFKPIFEYLKQNEDKRDEVINHQILVCGNDSAMGKLLMFHLISSMQTDPGAKAAGLIKNLNIEILDNINLKYYIFPFQNSSWNTQLANFLSAIDPVYEKFVQNVYDLTSHIAPTMSDSSNVSFIPVEENAGNETQKKIELPPSSFQQPPHPGPSIEQQESKTTTTEGEDGKESEEKSQKSEEEKSESQNDNNNEEEKKDTKTKNIIESDTQSIKESGSEHDTNSKVSTENEDQAIPSNIEAEQATNEGSKGFNEFDNNSLLTCNPTPSSMLQLAIQHFLLFAREHVDILVWSCVIHTNNKKIVIPFLTGVRLGFTSNNASSSSNSSSTNASSSNSSQGGNASSSNNNSNQNDEIKPKKLIIETFGSNNQTSDSQRVKLVSFSIWNSNMDLNCDPRSPFLLKEVCFNVSAHNQLLIQENLRANGPFSFASNRLSLIDSKEKKGKKKVTVNTNVVPTDAAPIITQQAPNPSNSAQTETNVVSGADLPGSVSQGEPNENVNEPDSCIIDLNDENDSERKITKKLRDSWAQLSFPKDEQPGLEQNLKSYTIEFIKGITVSVDKDQAPFSILVDGVEYEQVKKFSVEPLIDPANAVEQMKLRLACFSSI